MSGKRNPSLGCELDTDGDGDCAECHNDGGCEARRAKFAAQVRQVARNLPELRPIKLERVVSFGAPAIDISAAPVFPPLDDEGSRDRLVLLKPSVGPVDLTSERVELRAWRIFGAEVNAFLCQALAAQGETPDEKLLSLQHALAELLGSSAPQQKPNEDPAK